MAKTIASQARYWFGATLIALGVLFLLDNLGVLDFGNFIGTCWPSALIVVGLWQILARRRPWGGPLFLITLGIFFQVARLDIFPWWT